MSSGFTSIIKYSVEQVLKCRISPSRLIFLKCAVESFPFFSLFTQQIIKLVFLETRDWVFLYHRLNLLSFSEKKPLTRPKDQKSFFLIKILLNPMHFMCRDWCQVTMLSIIEFKNDILFSLEVKKKQSPFYSIFSTFFLVWSNFLES